MQNIEQMPIAGRERVCCYITRGRELLVFEHDQEYDDGATGTQVVGGGVDEGETLEQAALRETFEESGLVLERAIFLGTTQYESKFGALEGKKQVRHYFWLEAPPETQDSWSHTVSSGELDKGMVFHHRFVALEDVELVFEMGEMLDILPHKMDAGKEFSLNYSCNAVLILLNKAGEALFINNVVLWGQEGGGGAAILPCCFVPTKYNPIHSLTHYCIQLFGKHYTAIKLTLGCKVISKSSTYLYLYGRLDEFFIERQPLSEIVEGDITYTHEVHWTELEEWIFGPLARRIYEDAKKVLS